jgi:hypothetical protein
MQTPCVPLLGRGGESMKLQKIDGKTNKPYVVAQPESPMQETTHGC